MTVVYMRNVFICSTSGSVLKKAFEWAPDILKDSLIISDRNCGAVEFAAIKGIEFLVHETDSGLVLSDRIADLFFGREDVCFFSFYTRLFKGRFISEHAGRIINFHPSILPACPGRDGFGDTIKSGSTFVGSTVHLIDKGMDSGKPILQAAFPRNPNLSLALIRHRVFLQQVVSLIQVAKWFYDRRVVFKSGDLYIKDVSYDVSEFSPNIDRDLHALVVNEMSQFDLSRGICG